jgi:solute carrier family 25 phosphate transporter 3
MRSEGSIDRPSSRAVPIRDPSTSTTTPTDREARHRRPLVRGRGRPSVASLVFLVGLSISCCTNHSIHAFSPSLIGIHSSSAASVRRRPRQRALRSGGEEEEEDLLPDTKTTTISRRRWLGAVTGATFVALQLPLAAPAATPLEALTDLRLGRAQWEPLTEHAPETTPANHHPFVLPPAFGTAATDFVVVHDPAVQSWWRDHVETSTSTIAPTLAAERRERARTGLQASLVASWQQPQDGSSQSACRTNLYAQFRTAYGHTETARQEIDALFTLWPVTTTIEGMLPIATLSSLTAPLALLQRAQPVYGPRVYALLGLAGGAGCALTHATVIPLDVVKTRAQTNASSNVARPGQAPNLLQQASTMVESEGWGSLFLGAQATIAGYLWYGISVYPSYTASKRWIGQLALPLDVAAAHSTEIALCAGALAAVVASLGLTPLEAARIRAVAQPDTYGPGGLMGTLRVLYKEQVLYAGLPSLLTRQVLFGCVKFLAFEEFSAALSQVVPEAPTWAISLAAGAAAGAVSCVVSQPADAVLTYVAAQEAAATPSGGGDSSSSRPSLSLWAGLQGLLASQGPSALMRGLGSRTLWAGSIIAGQFFLYDIFRTALGVSPADLTQVLVVTMD